MVVDAKAGDRICRCCGEVQAGRLMNEDFTKELSRHLADDNDGKVERLERMGDHADSAAGESFVFTASAGCGGGMRANATVNEQLPALQRSSLSTQGRRERDLGAALRAAKGVHLALSLPRSVLVSAV